jgi:hypothetical protein
MVVSDWRKNHGFAQYRSSDRTSKNRKGCFVSAGIHDEPPKGGNGRRHTAVTDAGIQVSPADMQRLTKITPEAVGQLQAGVKSSKMGDADGTNTLLYAVAVATLIA